MGDEDDNRYSNYSKKRKTDDLDYKKNSQVNVPSSSISKIVVNHYNSIDEKNIEDRFKSKIYFMRNFNNWIKSIIISKYKDFSALLFVFVIC